MMRVPFTAGQMFRNPCKPNIIDQNIDIGGLTFRFRGYILGKKANANYYFLLAWH